MSKLFTVFAASAILLFTACGGKKETAESVSKKWCELNAKVKAAAGDAEKEAAKAARKAFEREMEEKHKADEAFMDKVKEITSACD